VPDPKPKPDATDAIGPVRMPLAWQIAIWLTLGVVVTAGIGLLLWLGLDSPAITGPNALKSQEKFDLIKIALAITGGIGGVIFLVIAYRKQRLGEAAEQRENAKEERENTKLFNERFATASEQLGHDTAAVRLAGVYAMAGLADDWEAGRQTCIEVLCAYLRVHYNPEAPEDPHELRTWHGEREVRHTIIRVISAHLHPSAPVSWQSHNFDFSGAVFDRGNFTRAVFSGGVVDFSEATFSGGVTNFIAVNFSGGIVDFTDTEFVDAEVNFVHADFSGARVNFSGAKFTSGEINFIAAGFSAGEIEFANAEFSGAEVNFTHSKFSGSTVMFADAKVSSGELNFVGVDFSGGTVDLIDAEISGAEVDFTNATFSGGKVGLPASDQLI
jgi:uncharacterized protein YjbI with pentapeptide repeats